MRFPTININRWTCNVMSRRPCMFVVYSIIISFIEFGIKIATVLLYLKSQKIGCNPFIRLYDTKLWVYSKTLIPNSDESPHSCAEFLDLSRNDVRANEHLMRCELTNIYNQIQSQPTKFYVFAEKDITKVFIRIVARIKIQNAENTCTESMCLQACVFGQFMDNISQFLLLYAVYTTMYSAPFWWGNC